VQVLAGAPASTGAGWGGVAAPEPGVGAPMTGVS
jgi:hypothetical protein